MVLTSQGYQLSAWYVTPPRSSSSPLVLHPWQWSHFIATDLLLPYHWLFLSPSHSLIPVSFSFSFKPISLPLCEVHPSLDTSSMLGLGLGVFINYEPVKVLERRKQNSRPKPCLGHDKLKLPLFTWKEHSYLALDIKNDNFRHYQVGFCPCF